MVSFFSFPFFVTLGACEVDAVSLTTVGEEAIFSVVGAGVTVAVGVVVDAVPVAAVALFSANQVLRAASHSMPFVLSEAAIVCSFSLRPSGIFSY